MNKKEQLEAYVEEHMLRRRYSDRTRESYSYWVLRIGEYFDKYSTEEFDANDVSAFIKDLEDRQGLSASTIKQAANALHFFFNTLGKKNIEIRGLRGKKVERAPSYVPTQKEVLGIIDSISSNRAKLAAMLAYSAGLDVEEIINISVTDIDFEKNTIKILLKRNRGVRYAVLAEYVKPILYSYIRANNPSKWVFESKQGKKTSPSVIQKGVKKAASKLEIKTEITAKSLKYAYVKHLEALGIGLLSILGELGLSHRSSLEFYSKLGGKKDKVKISPIDRRLVELPAKRQSLIEKEYVSEKRINELAEISNSEYDLTKLLELLREINASYRSQMHLAIAMLVRTVMDHVFPIFGVNSFIEVANNYKGSASFKKSMLHLNNSLRNIADAHLHTPIRKSEVLPTFIQVDFRADVDVLLCEITRIIKEKT